MSWQTLNVSPEVERQVKRLAKLVEFEDGRQLPVNAEALKGFRTESLALFCKREGLYQIVTRELIEFCRERIGSRKAIEVGAGRGCLGRSLWIPQTDSHLVQTRPEVRGVYRTMGEYVGPLPLAVERIAANEAVEKYLPQVVVACWLSQKGKDSTGNPYGADETDILRHVEEYILIGNGKTHGRKRILSQPHEKLHTGAPWLITRSMTPSENAIWIWKGKRLPA